MCDPVVVTITHGGMLDDFDGPEAADPSSQLVAHSGSGSKGFDTLASNQVFLHSIEGLPWSISEATLTLRVMPMPMSNSQNDSLALEIGAGGLIWSRRFGDLTGQMWQNLPAHEITLDLSEVPMDDGGSMSLLDHLISDGRLDIHIGDDTAVDWIQLRVFTEDHNSNGVRDVCDILQGMSQDVDGDGIPDESEPFLNITAGTLHVSLAEALQLCLDGDEIEVLPGTHPGTADLMGRAVTIRGVSGASATVLHSASASSVLRAVSGEGPATVLEGLTLSGGGPARGGGLYLDGASLVVRDCVFRDNGATVEGGGAWVGAGAPRFEGCLFEDNIAMDDSGAIASGGGGMFVQGGDPVLEGCTFGPNDSPGVRSLVLRSSDAQVLDCAFVGQSGTGASALYGQPLFERCRFSDAQGTGLALWYSAARVDRCRFERNVSSGSGAGMNLSRADGTVIVGCLFDANETAATGAAIYAYDSEFVVDSSTFHANLSGPTAGGAIYGSVWTGTLTVTNSIFWNNTLGEIFFPGADLAYNALQSPGWSFEGVYIGDPGFVDAANGDFHLRADSPCLDAGEPAYGGWGTMDLDDHALVLNGRRDMGAYEMQAMTLSLAPFSAGLLAPMEGPADPFLAPLAAVTNQSVVSGEASAVLLPAVASDAQLVPGNALHLVTDLPTGSLAATVSVPFDTADLSGNGFAGLKLLALDPDSGSWTLAAALNATSSPGFPGSVGNHLVESSGSPNLSPDIGDHGLAFDPQSGMGFVWANLDSGGLFAAGRLPTPPPQVGAGPIVSGTPGQTGRGASHGGEASGSGPAPTPVTVGN
jgi:hypothetical protein